MEFWERLVQAIKDYFSEEKGIRLGKMTGPFPFSENLKETELQHHVHILGASGFGKTVLLKKILKDQIKQGKGVLLLDQKGDIDDLEELTNYVKSLGREDDLKVFRLRKGKASAPYNVLSNGNATELRDRIIDCLTWSEEFYKNQAMSYLLKLLTAMIFLRDRTGPNLDLRAVYEGVTSTDFVFRCLQSIPPTEPAIRMHLEECYNYLNDKSMYHNLSGLRSQLESLLLTEFGSYLQESPDGISLFKAVQDSKIVFIFLDTRRYALAGKSLAKFMIKDLISTSAKVDNEIPRAKRKHFVSFVDEFADIADESFTSFADRARSSKMSLVLSHQDLSDLKRISPEFSNRLTANMSTLYAFLQSNDESANAISKRAGTKAAWKETKQTSRMLGVRVSTPNGTIREVEEFVIHPNVVKSLPVGRCVVIKKYPYARAHVIQVER